LTAPSASQALAPNAVSSTLAPRAAHVTPLAPMDARPALEPLVPPVPEVPNGDLSWLASVDALTGRFGCLSDGNASGAWTVQFAGYGCATIGEFGDATLLALQPAVATQTSETHAGLLLGPATSSIDADVDVRARLLTSRQLRTGAAPNPWEVGWLVWHYTDNDHFYYFIPKPNGWELGKRDPAYPGGQRF